MNHYRICNDNSTRTTILFYSILRSLRTRSFVEYLTKKFCISLQNVCFSSRFLNSFKLHKVNSLQSFKIVFLPPPTVNSCGDFECLLSRAGDEIPEQQKFTFFALRHKINYYQKPKEEGTFSSNAEIEKFVFSATIDTYWFIQPPARSAVGINYLETTKRFLYFSLCGLFVELSIQSQDSDSQLSTSIDGGKLFRLNWDWGCISEFNRNPGSIWLQL